MQQLALNIQLAPEPSFSRFFKGNNQAAVTHLQECVQQLIVLHASTMQKQPISSPTMAPVLLWGTTGCGKTHLLSAVALELQVHHLKVGWLSATKHAGQFQPTGFDHDWAAVILDDVDQFSLEQQQQAFNWFINASYPAQGSPIWVLASASNPASNLQMREDLRSRLGWGLTYQLYPPNDQQRLEVLRQQAQERGFELREDALHYLLTHFARDMSSLSDLLDKLDIHTLRTQRNITIPLLRDILQDPNSLDKV